ncbi:GNAT family N-acetyltransferase [Psychromonas aquimarina]|uniref:GNAT family N-acetyltransferase n=1 Tax=Psychromonas aquimarina TaxID=444919 RepID=UPI00040741D7|nr:GNAT family N-acetyltransferase [Psychromonas aquimarina]
MIHYRKAQNDEMPELKALLWKHGPNEWNYLPEQGVNETFSLMEKGTAAALIAVHANKIVGLSLLTDGSSSPSYLEKYCDLKSICFVAEVVVAKKFSGKGIAANLLKMCIKEAEKKGCTKVLIERHEENLASAGMMRKAGFKIIDTCKAPDKRLSGSQNNVVLQIEI